MRKGVWHQFGHNSQLMSIEQIQQGCGVGVIISPRDLPFEKAVDYADQYHDLGAHTLVDPQFYNPSFSNRKIVSYPTNESRIRFSSSLQLPDRVFDDLVSQIREMNQRVNADGVIAPALAYQAARYDIVQCNRRLFKSAQRAATSLGKPVYATVILGRSVTSSDQVVSQVLEHATSLQADGWYYAFEFESDRIPSSYEAVLRCCVTGLKLARTGKPVLHAYSGPMALLSQGFGAQATGVGHSQNLWNFTHGRWSANSGQGGGGDAPSRFFSRNLWGTIVYPDEIVQLSPALRSRVFTPSAFSPQQLTRPPTAFRRWESGKHLVKIIGTEVQNLSQLPTVRDRVASIRQVLQSAVGLLGQIGATGVVLRDDATSYQNNWLRVIDSLRNDHTDDYDYLDLIA